MIRSTLTQRWQTTIPAEVREALGLRPHQGLLYEIRGEQVVLRPDEPSLMDMAGCLKSDQPAGEKQEERRSARASRTARHTARSKAARG